MISAISTPKMPQLSRLITEHPREIAETQSRKAALYSLASKVCLVAFIAIAAGAIAISLGLIAPFHPALVLGLILSTIPLQFGFQGCLMRSFDCRKIANEAKAKADELTKIQHWQRPLIEAFFKEHKLSMDKLPMDLLGKIDRKEPYRALLPAIASYNYFCKQAREHFKEFEENLYNKIENPMLRLEARRIGYRKLEFEAIPTALQAALVLQIIAQPTLQLELKNLGMCNMKKFDERIFDQMIDKKAEYFVFNDSNRSPLTLKELVESLHPLDCDTLRLKLLQN